MHGPSPNEPPSVNPQEPGVWQALPAAIVIGLMIIVAALAALAIPRHSKMHDPLEFLATLIFAHGWTGYLLTFFFSWGLALNKLKARILKRERTAFALDLLSPSIAPEINQSNAKQFLSHIRSSVPADRRANLLVRMMERGLEALASGGSRSDLAVTMKAQSSAAAERLFRRTSPLNILIALVPLIGFFHTAFVLSSAAGAFMGTMDNSATTNNPDYPDAPAQDIARGIGAVFDTIFLGLMYALVLLICGALQQRAEKINLARIEEYCEKKFLSRLGDA